MTILNCPSTSLSAFIIRQCREFALFPNERTTLLSHTDELQVMQYCLACQNKKEGKEFDADPHLAMILVDTLNKMQTQSVEQTILDFHKGKQEQETSPADDNDISNEKCVTQAEGLASSIQNEEEVKTTEGLTCGVNELKLHDSIDGDISSGSVAATQEMFEEYKNASNHCTVLDMYAKFTKTLLDSESELYKAVTKCSQIYKLECEMNGYQEMQTKVIGLLKAISKADNSVSNPVYHCMENDAASPAHLERTNRSSPKTSHCNQFSMSPRTPTTKDTVTSAGNSPPEPSTTSKTPKTPFSQSQRKELQMLFVQDLFRSYLHLLVNSRSQHALARVFNIPDRGLDHDAFTHLKHEASNCGLSMYQTLSSFMMRIHLGGRGYAPQSDNPLMMHVKGLGSLLDMTQKLQTITEEVPELRPACRRVVNVIKNNLIQCKSGKFPRSIVEPVSEEIHNTLATIIQESEALAANSPERAINSGGSVLGRRCLRVLHQFLDRLALAVSPLDLELMGDVKFSTQSPTRFPCLLTQFRSPSIMDVEEEADESGKDKAKNISLPSTRGAPQCFVSSALYMENDTSADLILTQRTMSAIEVLPSKTVVHPRADSPTSGEQSLVKTTTSGKGTTGLANAGDVIKKCAQRKGGKRSVNACTDKENMVASLAQAQPGLKKRKENNSQEIESSPKSSKRGYGVETKNDTSTKSTKTCRRRLLPQVKGQAKITGFFRI